MAGRVTVGAVRLSAAACVGTLSILVIWFVHLLVYGSPNVWAMRAPQPITASEWVCLGCLSLWIGGALVGLVSSLVTRSQSREAGLKRSAALLGLLILIPFLLSMMPKS